MHGNLLRIDGTDGNVIEIFYDYSKPVNGLQSNMVLNNSFKLVEHLELLELPMHHEVTRIEYNDSPRNYTDYVVEDGLVISYKWNGFGFSNHTYYTGWDCGGSPATRAIDKKGINSLEQFRQVYPRQSGK
ncbi:MAG TPA: hypothetical protein VD993_18120 [Chitinophagaceae bacterium]|nr:hypothetical protein [Chitinophagaceae bacterium]